MLCDVLVLKRGAKACRRHTPALAILYASERSSFAVDKVDTGMLQTTPTHNASRTHAWCLGKHRMVFYPVHQRQTTRCPGSSPRSSSFVFVSSLSEQLAVAFAEGHGQRGTRWQRQDRLRRRRRFASVPLPRGGDGVGAAVKGPRRSRGGREALQRGSEGHQRGEGLLRPTYVTLYEFGVRSVDGCRTGGARWHV